MLLLVMKDEYVVIETYKFTVLEKIFCIIIIMLCVRAIPAYGVY